MFFMLINIVTGLLGWKTSSKQMRLLISAVYTVRVAVRSASRTFVPLWPPLVALATDDVTSWVLSECREGGRSTSSALCLLFVLEC